MRVKEPIKCSGYFWLPSCEEQEVTGYLSISDGGEIELEIVGSLTDDFNDDEPGRILGHVEKYGYITLNDCVYTQRTTNFNGLSKATIVVHQAILGAIFDPDEELLFNALKFSVEGIDEWVHISGFSFTLPTNPKDRSASITYQCPDKITFSLCNNMELSILFNWSFSESPGKKAAITQKAYFRLSADEKKPLRDFTLAAYKITTLLCFAIDQTVSIEDLEVTSKDIKYSLEKTTPKPCKVYYQSIPFLNKSPKINVRDMLFTYRQIEINAETLFNSWFQAYDDIKPALDLYFSVKNEAQTYLDGKFLALVQGLEAYHRKTSHRKSMSDAEYELLSQHLLSNCPSDKPKWCEWLTLRLKYGNEISLRNRITEIIKPYSKYFGNKKKRDYIINKIVDTRNYLSHWDDSLQQSAATSYELWPLFEATEALFQLQLLRILGFTNKEINSILDLHLKNKLKGVLQ